MAPQRHRPNYGITRGLVGRDSRRLLSGQAIHESEKKKRKKQDAFGCSVHRMLAVDPSTVQ